MEFGNENDRVRMEGDRISSLPDEIIHHILSFNDTKYAVQTSVLSSRWKLIWTTLPYLKFSTYEFRILPTFSKFVNRVLSLRNNRTEVSSVDLYFRGPPNQKFMQKIADYAVSHNVQNVNMYASRPKSNEDHQFPLCFFNSQSLKHLSVKINGPLYNFFPLPLSPWNCPALTSIELKGVWLCAGNVVCLDLFSKCVNLKNLTLSSCRSRGLKVIKILCPRLVCLKISHCDASEYEISAPNLSYFYYEDGHSPILSTCGLKSLEKVNLHMLISWSMLDNEGIQRKAHEFINMLHQLRNAKFVTIYGHAIEFLSKVMDLLEHQPSPFCNLKCLRIEGLERPKKRVMSDLTNQVINFFLNSSPTAAVSIEYYQKETFKQHRRGTSHKESLTCDPNQVLETYFQTPEFETRVDAAFEKALVQFEIEDNKPTTHDCHPPPRSDEGSSNSNSILDVQAFIKTPQFHEMIDRAAQKVVHRRIMARTQKVLQRAGIEPLTKPVIQNPPSPSPP